ncbi:type II toxin-antitoxin system HicB family antitoxin [Cohnella soli]|uniref:Type II toxin-antitoxin system HicB family antitoxin n=1 Tax=Cohnella soli TaxID=425005 RepID=A0ABW0HPH7_9BACL
MMNFTVLLEQDFASNNFTAYVPELRLSSVGDTEEEAMDCVKELIALELEKGRYKIYSSKVVSVTVDSIQVRTAV